MLKLAITGRHRESELLQSSWRFQIKVLGDLVRILKVKFEEKKQFSPFFRILSLKLFLGIYLSKKSRFLG